MSPPLPAKRTRRTAALVASFALLALAVVVWGVLSAATAVTDAGFAEPQSAARQGGLFARQDATPTPALSSEDIESAPTYTTGIIILSSLVVMIIISGTLGATRRGKPRENH
jgi:hypothetical protein